MDKMQVQCQFPLCKEMSTYHELFFTDFGKDKHYCGQHYKEMEVAKKQLTPVTQKSSRAGETARSSSCKYVRMLETSQILTERERSLVADAFYDGFVKGVHLSDEIKNND